MTCKIARFSLIILLTFFLSFIYGLKTDIAKGHSGFWTPLYFIKICIEFIAGSFAIFYLLVALAYKKPSANKYQADSSDLKYPNVAVTYLCCDDLDQRALENIASFCLKNKTRLVVHDDSLSEKNHNDLYKLVSGLQQEYFLPIEIICRLDRVGGKPGALNNIIDNLPDDVEFLLICDSDSFLPNACIIEEILSYFNDPQVSLVQFRNIGFTFKEDYSRYKKLSKSIDFYDIFVSFMSRFGWSPFLGHNALLRVSIIREGDGFTSGHLADDIDYSVKLRLRGYQIRYARHIISGERHPLSYEALRRRTQKWAYGCTQIFLRWGWAVLISDKLFFFEKLSFFLTVGYYHFQILLFFYLIIFYILFPLMNQPIGGTLNLLFSSGLILFFTFFPSITYFAQHYKFSDWLKIGIIWSFTYGSQDILMLKAIIKCLVRYKLKWIPTNGSLENLRIFHYCPEVLFGILIISIASLKNPILLLLPTTLLFAGKFLISPFLNKWVFSYKSRFD